MPCPPPAVRLAALLPLALLSLGGCAAMRFDAPSLAPRAIERQPVPLPDEASEPVSAADPALAPRLATILAAAEAGQRGFEGAEKAAAVAAARPGARQAGSEAWIAAQQALSALDAARAPLTDAAAALDALRADPAYAGPTDRAAIEAATARIEALRQAQATALARHAS